MHYPLFGYTVEYVASYRRFGRQAGHADYVITHPALSLHVRGITRYAFQGHELRTPDPFLILHAPGTEVSLRESKTRCSWSVGLRTDALRTTETWDRVAVRSGREELLLPTITWLQPDQVRRAEAEYARMDRCFRSPVPEDRLRAHLGVASLLRYVLDGAADVATESPGAKLKRLIDEDERVRENLTALSRRCGFSPNHLRILFAREFGITPLAYRNHVRMTRARALLRDGELSVKQIADMTGFRHVSHFSRLFRQTFGDSPREARDLSPRSSARRTTTGPTPPPPHRPTGPSPRRRRRSPRARA